MGCLSISYFFANSPMRICDFGYLPETNIVKQLTVCLSSLKWLIVKTKISRHSLFNKDGLGGGGRGENYNRAPFLNHSRLINQLKVLSVQKLDQGRACGEIRAESPF